MEKKELNLEINFKFYDIIKFSKKLFVFFVFILFFISLVKAVTLFTDDFESESLSGWTLFSQSGANNWTISKENPYQEWFHAQSNQSSSLEPASVIERNISTLGYKNITFSYYRRLIGLDPADEFQVKYHNGASWKILEQTGSNSEDDADYLYKVFKLNADAENKSNLTIRFECTAELNSEFCRIDDVLITGDTITEEDTTPPQIIINYPTNSTINTATPRLNITIIEKNVSSVWISVDNKKNVTYSYGRNGTIDFGYLDLIFADDFNNYEEGSDGYPTWIVLPEFGNGSVFNKTYRLFNETPLIDALAYINSSFFSELNYGGSAKVMVPFGYNGSAYLTPRFGDVNNKYEIALDFQFSSININKVAESRGESWSQLAAKWTGEFGIFVNRGEWRTLGFDVYGNNISAYVDNILMLSVEDSSLNNETFSGFSLISLDDVNSHMAFFDDLELHKKLTYGSHTLTVYANDSAGNINSTTLVFFVNVDSTPPNVTLLAPLNNSLLTKNMTFFSAIFADDVQLTNSTFYLWNSTKHLINVTTTSISGTINQTNLSVILPYEGVFYWNYLAYDSSNNFDFAKENFTINYSLDMDPPLVTIIEPKNITYTSLPIVFNISTNEEAIANYTLDNGVNNFTMVANSSKTGFIAINNSIANGSYIVRFYVWDMEGNLNDTETVAFSVNATLEGKEPIINISYPSFASTYGNKSSIPLNFSVNGSNIDKCWFSLNNGLTNTTIVNCANTTFNVSSNGEYNLTVYSNESIEGLVGSASLKFYVKDGHPTIHLLNPFHEEYKNSSEINFTYIPLTFEVFDSCELLANLYGNYSSLQRNNTILNENENNFIFSNITEGNYSWAIKCNTTSGNISTTGNRTLFIDMTKPNISIGGIETEYNTDNGNASVTINFNVTDSSPTTCYYNLTYNTTNFQINFSSFQQCQNVIVNFELSPNTYNLHLGAQDAANNREEVKINIVIGSGGDSNREGKGAGGYNIPQKKTDFEITLPQKISIEKGTRKNFSIQIKNTGNLFLNKCFLIFEGDGAKWLTNSEQKGLSPGEIFIFNVEASIPDNVEVGNYLTEIKVQCKELSKKTNLVIEVFRNIFEAKILDYERIGNKLKVRYFLKENANQNQEINIKYSLLDFNGLLRYSGKESVKLFASEQVVKELSFELPKDSFGEFKFVMEFNNGEIVITDVMAIFLPSRRGLTGLIISEENKKALTWLTLVLIGAFLIALIIKTRKKKKMEERNDKAKLMIKKFYNKHYLTKNKIKGKIVKSKYGLAVKLGKLNNKKFSK